MLKPVAPLLLLIFSISAQAAQTVLMFESDAGDYIGGGKTLSFTSNEMDFNISKNYDNGVSIQMNSANPANSDQYGWWNLDFAAPNNALLMVGEYLSATRFPFQKSNEAGLSLSGDGRGCNSLKGSFTILEVTYDATNQDVLSFAANFIQHCEGVTPALTAAIRYNSDIPVPNDLVPTELAATLYGMSMSKIRCINHTTRERVVIRQTTTQHMFNCTTAGLVVNPGDSVSIFIDGQTIE